jgi:protoheme IX farnesyltransferase
MKTILPTKVNKTYSSALHAFCVLMSSCTLVLISAGGLVTSTDSGLAVPDWPLSYGTLFPPMVGGIIFEHTHRVIAGLVGLLTLILTLWVMLKEKRRWMKGLSLAALGAVMLQAVLGGITVLYYLPTAVSVAHACLAQTFFCMIIAMTVFTSRDWMEGFGTMTSSMAPSRFLYVSLTAIIFFQLVLGAFLRHTGEGVVQHIIGGLAVFILSAMVAALSSRCERRFWLGSGLLFVAVLGQIALGFFSLYFTHVLPASRQQGIEVYMTTAHQTMGALLLSFAVVLTIWSSRYPYTGQLNLKRHLQDFIMLIKPRPTLMAVLMSILGFVMASDNGIRFVPLIRLTLGSLLIGAGASILNQWMERHRDVAMRRTENRPIPQGRIPARTAIFLGCFLSIMGLGYLVFHVNPLSGAVGLAILVLYLMLYTVLKTKTQFSLWVGAVPGALPMVLGWSAAKNSIDPQAWVLFLILFVWQFPHFMAIAWIHREDYQRGGFRVLSVQDPDGVKTSRFIFLSSVILLGVSLIPFFIGMMHQLYLAAALVVSISFLIFSSRLKPQCLDTHAKPFLLASVVYLPLVCLFMVLDKLILGTGF